MHAIQENNLTHTKYLRTVSEPSEMKPVSCSNECATIDSYTQLLLQDSSGNIPSCALPNLWSDWVQGGDDSPAFL